MLKHAKSFYGKILLTIMLCFVFPLSIVFLYGYHRMESVMMEKMEQLTTNNLNHMGETIQDLSDRVNQTSSYISNDMRLNDLLREYTAQIPDDTGYRYRTGSPEFMDSHEYMDLSVEMQNILINYVDNWLGESVEMGIIGNDGHLFSTWPEGNTDYEQLDAVVEAANQEERTYFTDIHPRFILYEENTDYFTYVKVLHDMKAVKTRLGVLVVTVPLSAVENIVEKYRSSEMYALYMINRDHEVMDVISQDEEHKVANRFLTNMAVKAEEGIEIVRDEDGKRYLLNTYAVNSVDWKLCYVVPYEEVFKEALIMRKYVIGVCASLIFVLAVISLLVIYRLFAPLRLLKDSMEKVEGGQWEIEALPSSSNDEIGMLTSGFNRLTAELKHMLQREKESERQKGELRFEMLLAQINPHFLFNTLNSIKWMATMIHAENITNMIHSLARLLEISMNKQADVITIREELQNLDSYLDIQSVRYSDLFNVQYQLSEDIGGYQTLKLVFQPIVENAIIHNIQEVSSLNIDIEGKIENGCIVFRVSDNGKGMSAQAVETLMAGTDISRESIFRGIGVSNVQQRIKLKYGEQYGVHVESEIGSGTVVEIKFPAIPYERVEDEQCLK